MVTILWLYGLIFFFFSFHSSRCESRTTMFLLEDMEFSYRNFFKHFFLQHFPTTFLPYLHSTLSNARLTSGIQGTKSTQVGNATICNIHEGRRYFVIPVCWRVKQASLRYQLSIVRRSRERFDRWKRRWRFLGFPGMEESGGGFWVTDRENPDIGIGIKGPMNAATPSSLCVDDTLLLHAQ